MRTLRRIVLLVCLLQAGRACAAGGGLTLPPGTLGILDHIYAGKLDMGIAEAKQLQQKLPNSPLGYLLEAEGMWWKIWCSSAEYKYGMTMARRREKLKSDQAYLDVAMKAESLAEAALKQQETAEMHLYAGMADGLQARLHGLRGEARAVARTGVQGREHFLKALSLDGSLADADFGLGLYDYYVDTLSALARMLRFLMGIPGGSKADGIRLMNRAIQNGQLTPVVARFYLAINLENYDQKYEEALAALGPLTEKYPDNPLFQLVKGDLNAKLGRKREAAAAYRAALAAHGGDAECEKKAQGLAKESLQGMGEPIMAGH